MISPDNHRPIESPLASRRALLVGGGLSLAAMALASLEESRGAEATSKSHGFLTKLHIPPTAKRVIFLTMSGGPSHIDLFDPKPTITKMAGEPIPESIVRGERFAQLNNSKVLLPCPHKFAKHGKSGVDFSLLLPQMAGLADEWTIVRSMTTDAINHDPAMVQLNTGATLPGRPACGSWVSYGLGTENENLPAFVVLNSGVGQSLAAHNWSAGFLPTEHQGVQFRGEGDPVLFLSDPAWVERRQRRQQLDTLARLNQLEQAATGDSSIAARVAAYEAAFRMQTSVPELADLSQESPETLVAYGVDPKQASYARNCLLARRLVERGVRFVQLYHRDWDHHGTRETGGIDEALPKVCHQVDQASAALLRDLKQRGLLKNTLVIWGGEFGRTPMRQIDTEGKFFGRDHHRRAFTMLMAGGGMKPGITFGKTDDFGFHVVENRVHVHDLQATILHCLGIDHTQLTFRHQGRDYRLTDVEGEVVKGLLA